MPFGVEEACNLSTIRLAKLGHGSVSRTLLETIVCDMLILRCASVSSRLVAARSEDRLLRLLQRSLIKSLFVPFFSTPGWFCIKSEWFGATYRQCTIGGPAFASRSRRSAYLLSNFSNWAVSGTFISGQEVICSCRTVTCFRDSPDFGNRKKSMSKHSNRKHLRIHVAAALFCYW